MSPRVEARGIPPVANSMSCLYSSGSRHQATSARAGEGLQVTERKRRADGSQSEQRLWHILFLVSAFADLPARCKWAKSLAVAAYFSCLWCRNESYK